MTSLFMGAVVTGPVPTEESKVRETATPVIKDAPAAMASNAPDRNEVETDPNPDLGMESRQLASAWHQPQKYAPSWAGEVDAGTKHNSIVNEQVSSSGTAAQRELSGQFGHGTMGYAEGIEPVADLVDGGKMTNNYFAGEKPGANPTAGQYMQPGPGADDRRTVSRTGAAGKDAARRAAIQSMYAAYLDRSS